MNTLETTNKNTSVNAENVQQRRAVAPHVDIYENNQELLVLADLPGIERDAIRIDLHKQELTLEAKTGKARSNGEKSRREFDDGADFRRAFVIPNGIDASAVKADWKNGVLWVHLPKVKELQPRRIEISAG